MDIKKALLAIDFSRPAMQLIDSLDELQAIGLEEVFLVHVIDVRAPGGAAISLKSFDEEMLNKQKTLLESKGLKVKVVVQVGIPNFEIVKIAQAEKVSLILISSHGKGFIKNIFLGSTTKDVIRTSTVPVLIEKYRDVAKDSCSIMCANKFTRVLLPLDFSIHSQKLVDEIQGISPSIGEVIVMAVIEGAYNEEDLTKTIQAREAQLAATKQYLEQMGLKVRTMVEQGSASAKIIEAAEKEDVTLIMLATRGEGLIKDLLLGSTAHAVAKRSKRPVLLIPTSGAL